MKQRKRVTPLNHEQRQALIHRPFPIRYIGGAIWAGVLMARSLEQNRVETTVLNILTKVQTPGYHGIYNNVDGWLLGDSELAAIVDGED